MPNTAQRSTFIRHLLGALALSALAPLGTGCTAVGPTTGAISSAAAKGSIKGIQIVTVNDMVARSLHQARVQDDFATKFAPAQPIGSIVGPGDVLEISIWEAPPATLFGTSLVDVRTASSLQTSRGTGLPEYLVTRTGNISVPFAGLVPVAGRTLPEIENDIVTRLSRKAHLPQVMVRLVRNATATVTVVGEVASSMRMPLTPKGERLLDALAAAGGTRQPVGKMTIQLSREGVIRTMPLEALIRDPRQNIVLRTDDVITAFYQPYSFTVLGATGRNAELDFEATGLTMAQALGRIGGLQDMRADPKGVFLFRWEDPALVPHRSPETVTGPDGKVPVIYRIDMKDPGTYFAMQNFDVRDKDVIYVANSTVAEFQRFVNIMASAVLPIVTVDNAVSN